MHILPLENMLTTTPLSLSLISYSQQHLPNELWLSIFKRIVQQTAHASSLSQLAKLSKVSRQWHLVSQDASLWRIVSERLGYPSPTLSCADFRQWVFSQHVYQLYKRQPQLIPFAYVDTTHGKVTCGVLSHEHNLVAIGTNQGYVSVWSVEKEHLFSFEQTAAIQSIVVHKGDIWTLDVKGQITQCSNTSQIVKGYFTHRDHKSFLIEEDRDYLESRSEPALLTDIKACFSKDKPLYPPELFHKCLEQLEATEILDGMMGSSLLLVLQKENNQQLIRLLQFSMRHMTDLCR